jgi:hypothetical protein
VLGGKLLVQELQIRHKGGGKGGILRTPPFCCYPRRWDISLSLLFSIQRCVSSSQPLNKCESISLKTVWYSAAAYESSLSGTAVVSCTAAAS